MDKNTEFIFSLVENEDLNRLKKINVKTFNIRNKNGYSLLYMSLRCRKKIIKYLLENGADTEFVNMNGDTAILCAARENNFRGVYHLSKAGANIHVQDKFGSTLLLWAVRNKNIAMVEYLMNKGLDIAHRDRDNTNALSYAISNCDPHMTEFLLERNVDFEPKKYEWLLSYSQNNGNKVAVRDVYFKYLLYHYTKLCADTIKIIGSYCFGHDLLPIGKIKRSFAKVDIWGEVRRNSRRKVKRSSVRRNSRRKVKRSSVRRNSRRKVKRGSVRRNSRRKVKRSSVRRKR